MDKKYFVEIDGICAEGESRQEFVMNYLAALYEKNKGLDNMSRIQAYVQHFVNNFSYDKDLRNKIVDDEGLNTFEKSEEALCNLFVNKKGVCQQKPCLFVSRKSGVDWLPFWWKICVEFFAKIVAKQCTFCV